MLEKIFKLSENKTTVRTELVAGLTTFMTMAYIIALNPNLLTNFATGSPLWNGVFRPPVWLPPLVCSAWHLWPTSPLPWHPAWV